MPSETGAGVLGDALGRISELESQLEHAKSALAGDNEGVRLWMLDCGALVEKHRKRADEATAALDARASRSFPAPPTDEGYVIECFDCEHREFWLLRREGWITFKCVNCGSHYHDDEGFGRP